MAKRAVIYVRVSTDQQTTENQLLAARRYCELQDWNIVDIYEDHGISGAKDSRPGLDRLKDDITKNRFDVVVVWKLDRLARSTQHLLDILSTLRRYGIAFTSVTESIDTSTASGRMLTAFLAAISEFEREIIRERVVAGLDRARENGVKLGRPRVGFDVADAVRLKGEGLGVRRIARRLGVSPSTIQRALKGISEANTECRASVQISSR